MDRVPFNVSTNSHRNGPPNWQATTFSFGINATPLKKVYYWMGLIRPLSQFNANNAYDVYGTAIETFRTFETRNLFIPLDDYIASHASYSDFDPALFQVRVIQGQDLLHPDWVEQYHGESYL